MKIWTIIYATNDYVGSRALMDSRGRDTFNTEEEAEKVLHAIWTDEVETNDKRIFDSAIYNTNARIEYDDDTWLEYRVIQLSVNQD